MFHSDKYSAINSPGVTVYDCYRELWSDPGFVNLHSAVEVFAGSAWRDQVRRDHMCRSQNVLQDFSPR